MDICVFKKHPKILMCRSGRTSKPDVVGPLECCTQSQVARLGMCPGDSHSEEHEQCRECRLEAESLLETTR